MLPTQKVCDVCHFQILETYYFCPNCGKNLKPTPLPTNLLKQIEIYTISILLPPFGLWPAVKYIRENNKTAKVIGVVSIILTIASIVVSTWLLKAWVTEINNQVNSQLNKYQNLGF